MVGRSTRVITESNKAQAVEILRGRPVRQPSPMKSPASINQTVKVTVVSQQGKEAVIAFLAA
jgi:hypothetical protein